MRSLPVLLTLSVAVTLVGSADSPGESPSEFVQLEFSYEVQNLRVASNPLQQETPTEIGSTCPGAEGVVRYGKIPNRLPDESMYSTDNFLNFAAVYGGDDTPRLLIDFNRDLKLDCSETSATIAHPHDAGTVFRTVVLDRGSHHPAAGHGPRRYRLILPAHLSGDESDHYEIDLVDIPVARWEVDGTTTTWILFDGNHNGLHDRRLGDGLLVDLQGDQVVETSASGPNFRSYEAVLQLAWGNFEIVEVDPRGRHLTLARTLAAPPPPAPVNLGDVVAPVSCSLSDGSEITLGGSAGRYQILYFWLSRCGACKRDLDLLLPLSDRMDPSRIGLIGVSLDEDRADYDSFIADGLSGRPQCFEGKSMWDNAIARSYDVHSPSEFLLVGPGGRLVARGHGYHDLEDALRSVLPEALPRVEGRENDPVGGS